MAKISTPKTSVKIIDRVPPEASAVAQTAEEQHVNTEISSKEETPHSGKPSAHIISNILNYSKALSVKRTSNGTVIANVMN